MDNIDIGPSISGGLPDWNRRCHRSLRFHGRFSVFGKGREAILAPMAQGGTHLAIWLNALHVVPAVM